MIGALAALVVGILLADRFEVGAAAAWIAFAALAALTMAVRRHRMAQVGVLAATAMLGAGLHAWNGSRQTVPQQTTLYLELEVNDIPVRHKAGDRATARIVLCEYGGREYTSRENTLLLADTTLAIRCGDRISCVAEVLPLNGQGPAARTLRRRGFTGSVNLSADNTVGIRHSAPSTLHAAAVERINRLGLSGAAEALAAAMAAGDTSKMDARMRHTYSRSGLAHLLAVSGLHVGIVMLLVDFCLAWLSLLKYGNLLRYVAVLIPVWLYAAACGMPASVARAAAMLTIVRTARIKAVRHSMPNTLAITALIMLVADTDLLFDISFQLSFTAVAAIVCFNAPFEPLYRRLAMPLRILLKTAVVSISATLAATPLISSTFGIIAPAGIVLSPAAMLCCYVIISLSMLWIAMPVQALAGIFAATVSGAAKVLDSTAAALETCPCAWFECTMPPVAVAAAYLLLAAAAAAALICSHTDNNTTRNNDPRTT